MGAPTTVSGGAGITVDKSAIEGLIYGLKVASHPTYIGKKIDLKEIADASLDVLKEVFFPQSVKSQPLPKKDYKGHLERGWRVFMTPSNSEEAGFTIRNVLMDSNSRVQTILKSLDKGSKGYIRELGNKKALSFAGKPGRATRPNKSYSPFIFTSRHIYIPARRPINYIEKTYRFVEDLIVRKFPDYTRGLRTDMRRWANKD